LGIGPKTVALVRDGLLKAKELCASSSAKRFGHHGEPLGLCPPGL